MMELLIWVIFMPSVTLETYRNHHFGLSYESGSLFNNIYFDARGKLWAIAGNSTVEVVFNVVKLEQVILLFSVPLD